MQVLRRVAVAALASTALLRSCLGQDMAPMFTEPNTNISFGTWSLDEIADPDAVGQHFYQFGIALPPDALKKDATEYIGYLRCEVYNSTMQGWCGVSHGTGGQMTSALLLVAWPYKDQVLYSFRYASAWIMPALYTGKPKITQIYSYVNDSQYEMVYRCENCFSWTSPSGVTTNVSTTTGQLVLGRAQAAASPEGASCPDKIKFGFHDAGYGQYGANLNGVANPSYSAWAALATHTVSTACLALPTSTSTPASVVSSTKVATSVGSPLASRATGPSSSSAVSSASVSSSATASLSISSSEAVSTPATTSELPKPTPTAPTVTAPTCTPVTSNKTYDYIIVGAGAGGIPLADRLTESGKTVLLIEKGPPSSGRWGGTMRPEWLADTNLTRFDVPGLCNEIWVNSVGVACTDTDQMEGCVLGGGTAVNAGLWWKANPRDWDYNFPAGWHANDMEAATDRVFKRIPGTIAPSMDGKLYMDQGYNVLASGLNASGWGYVVPNDEPGKKNRVYGHTTYMFSNGERSGPMATYLVSASKRPEFTLWMNTPVRRLIRTGGHVTGVELECSSSGYIGNISVTPNTGRVILSAGTFASAKILLRSGIGPADQLRIVRGSTDGPTMISNNSWIDLPVGYNLNDHVNTDTEISHPNVSFYDFYTAWDKPIESDKSTYLTNKTGILAQAAPNIGPIIWEEIKGSDGIVRQVVWTARVEGSTNTSMTISQNLGRGTVSRGRMTITRRLDTFVSLPPYLHDDLDKEAIIKGIESLQEALKNVEGLTWITPSPNQTVTQYVNSLPVTASKRRSNHWIGSCKMGTDDGRAGGSAVVDTDTRVYGTDNLFIVDASIYPGQGTSNPSGSIVTVAERAFDRISAIHAPVPGRLNEQCGGSSWTGSFLCSAGLECVYENSTTSTCKSAAPAVAVPAKSSSSTVSSSISKAASMPAMMPTVSVMIPAPSAGSARPVAVPA